MRAWESPTSAHAIPDPWWHPTRRTGALDWPSWTVGDRASARPGWRMHGLNRADSGAWRGLLRSLSDGTLKLQMTAASTSGSSRVFHRAGASWDDRPRDSTGA